MANEKTDPGGVGVQIDPPSRGSTPPPPPAPLPTHETVVQTTHTSHTSHAVSFALPTLPKSLTLDEKKYLLSVERGDLANVRRILQRAHRRQHIDINCVDSLGRGSLTIGIDGENLEMVELLVIMGVQTKDALLQAINAEFVEAVELLLEHEELIHLDGEPYSWQKVETNTSMFTPDITPLVLAAHRNNYEILKILLDRGASIPMPHDIRCGCDDCIVQSAEDSLRHSLSRVNEYRALASPSLIALSSNDPLLTAFQLSWELRSLAFAEQECKAEYLDLRRQCQQFAVDLLDQSRSSKELAIILNYDPEAPPYVEGDHMQLARLELAISYKQKKFVAHPNIQQLLAALWYEGVPGFRRKSSLAKMFIILRVALLFPLYCLVYMIAPNCRLSVVLKKPFMKFLVHASSYLCFLFILIMVSQRAEVHVIQMFGSQSAQERLREEMLRQRGNGPTKLELLVVLWVLGFIWEETQEIYMEGMRRYLRNMWNFIDFSRNFLYTAVGALRVVAYYQQKAEIALDPQTAFIARENWTDYDPQLIAEGLFAAANIFSALKLVHLFSINPHLGPLQVSLGRMVIDIVKFFFIYSLVLFAFACGLNQLLWYFADLEKKKCFRMPGGEADWDDAGDSCMKWRRFGNLFESSQSLFWASFGLVGLESFELAGIKTYTRFWGLLMFGSYCVINVIVLLNLLIAMMSNSYAAIDEQSDTEWKFARTKLWMSYFDNGPTLPPPFNVLPTVKWLTRWFRRRKRHSVKRGSTMRRKEDRDNRYTQIMRSLVWRYVSAKHRRDDESAVTEDDINEVKCDISAMRYEMLEIFERNGMDISSAEKKEKDAPANAASMGKKVKIWERRLMKDFQVAPIQTDDEPQPPAFVEPVVKEKPAVAAGADRGIDRFRRVAKQVADQTATAKWGVAVRGVRDTQIGRCHNRESFANQQNLRRAIQEAKRLIENGPSRATSPVHYYDPQATTLLELLRNISEEVEEYDPQNDNHLQPPSDAAAGAGSGHPSPIATLSEQLRRLSHSRQPSPNSQVRGPMGNLVGQPKAKSLEPPAVCSRVQPSRRASQSLEPASDLSTLNIPQIQISRTESQLGERSTGGDEDLESGGGAVPKVAKRRAPDPSSSARDRSVSPAPRAAIPAVSQRPSGSLAASDDKQPASASSSSRARSPSPVCLRPARKIDDVTTVKRPPKNGWL